MRGLFAQAWQRLNAETIGSKRYWWIALQNAAIYADTKPLIAKYVHGHTLDVAQIWTRLSDSGVISEVMYAKRKGQRAREESSLP